ncbi:MAG: DUF2163 domain-containing protein [Pseudomonadota bacterium]
MPVPFPPGLLSYLQAGGGDLCRVLRIERRTGEVDLWTDHDADIELGGETYLAQRGFNVSGLEYRTDGSVSGGDLEALISIDGVTREQLLGGVLDGARVTLSVVVWSNPSLGAGVLSFGWIGQADESGTGRMTLELRGLAQALEHQIVPIVTQACPARFVSQPGEEPRPCRVDAALHTVSVSVVSATRDVVTVSGADGAATYVGGRLTFTSGVLSGVRTGVRSADADTGALTLYVPLPVAPGAGDTAELLAGCDKSIQTCRDRYNNVVNFRGQPFLQGRDYLTRIGSR